MVQVLITHFLKKKKKKGLYLVFLVLVQVPCIFTEWTELKTLGDGLKNLQLSDIGVGKSYLNKPDCCILSQEDTAIFLFFWAFCASFQIHHQLDSELEGVGNHTGLCITTVGEAQQPCCNLEGGFARISHHIQ